MNRLVLLTLSVVLLDVSFAEAQLLVNGDFEAPAILGPTQTPIAPNSGKKLAIDLLAAGYADAISAIPNWANGFVDVGFGSGVRDAGLSRIDFDGSGNGQYAFIDNWETRLSQTTPRIIQPGESYTASFRVGFVDTAEKGRLQLWAGEPDPAPTLWDDATHRGSGAIRFLPARRWLYRGAGRASASLTTTY